MHNDGHEIHGSKHKSKPKDLGPISIPQKDQKEERQGNMHSVHNGTCNRQENVGKCIAASMQKSNPAELQIKQKINHENCQLTGGCHAVVVIATSARTHAPQRVLSEGVWLYQSVAWNQEGCEVRTLYQKKKTNVHTRESAQKQKKRRLKFARFPQSFSHQTASSRSLQ